MADAVHYAMEGLVPDLRELHRKNIISEREVQAILRRRTEFEYQMQRRQPIKHDFLNAIEYELNLEELRSRRREKLVKEGVKYKADSNEYCIQRRVSSLYQRALRKFSDDLTLWEQYFDYSISCGSSKVLSKTMARALQLHPTCPRLWMRVAALEFDYNNNVAGARVFMQRGLRLNPTSQSLWLSFFKMEVIYCQRLLAQRRARPIGTGGNDRKHDDFSRGAVPRLLFSKACDEIRDDPAFCVQFVPLVPNDSWYDPLRDFITRSCTTQFPKHASSWYTRATSMLSGSGDQTTRESCAAMEFETAVDRNCIPVLWEAYALFAEQRVLEWMENRDDDAMVVYLFNRVMSVMHRAREFNCLTELMFAIWLRCCLRNLDFDQFNLVARLALDAFPSSADLQLQVINVKILLGDKAADKMFDCAISSVLKDVSLQIWISRFEHAMALEPSQLHDLYSLAATQVPQSLCVDLKQVYLDASRCSYRLEDLRTTIERISTYPPYSPELMISVLDASAPFDDIQWRRSLFEKSVTYCGAETSAVWRIYIAFERDQKEFGRAQHIYWRASHALAANSSELAVLNGSSR